MIDKENKYSKMQKDFYDMASEGMNSGGLGGHIGHNDNLDYWDILLGNIKHDPESWFGKTALDFGCGCGRNVINLLKLSEWNEVYGVDISKNNIINSEKAVGKAFPNKYNTKFFVNNGIDLSCLSDNLFDFVMSTIVFEHICVHEIRYNLMKEIYRVIKEGGLFSFQMCYDKEPDKLSTENDRKYIPYFEDYYDADGTNSKCDCLITDPNNQIIKDLEKIGFKNISYSIEKPFSSGHQNWIYIKCYK